MPKKIHLDQWFTRDDWAQACVDDLLKEMPELKGSQFLEPSAGSGAFMRALEARGEVVEGWDLEPQGEGVQQADFLLDNVDCKGKVVIGNPPYGFKSTLARAFVKKAFKQGATHVAFLLLGGFTRSSIMWCNRKLEYFKKLEAQFILPNGEPLTQPALWNSWVVLSAGDLQESTKYLERANFDDASVFFARGKSLGDRDECQAEWYPVLARQPYFAWVKDKNGRRIVGQAFHQLQPLPEDRSVIEMISSETGNSAQPSPETMNFWLSNPELYRGEIDL